MENLPEQIENLIQPLLIEVGAELVDLNVQRNKKGVHIEILVDKESGGITLDECAELNKRIGNMLEEKNLIERHYFLEVCSPGIDRPLRTVKDFVRALGRNVRVFLSQPVHEKIEYAGTITGVEGEQIIMDIKGEKILIPFDKINKGKQIF